MKILFRISGGQAPCKELGMGHVYRAINLASNLKGNEIYFLVEDYGGVKKLLQEKGFDKICLLENGISLRSDIAKTILHIKKKMIDITIIDKYNINLKFLKEIKKFTKTVVISDLRKFNYPADLVINGFIGFKNQIAKNTYGTTCLLGPAYQILNKKFIRKNIRYKKKYSLLATFGGFDENNIVEILLMSLEKYLVRLKIKIILGPSTPKTNIVKKFMKKYRNNLEIVQSVSDMHKEISASKFGICAGGITTYEFASMSIPFAIICQVRHQLVTAREWERRGIAINLGLVGSKLQQKIQKLLENIINAKIGKTKIPIIDGYGSKRVAQKILKIHQ